MRNATSIAAFGGCIILLGACTTDLQKSQAQRPQSGTEFTRTLGQNYHAMADNQWSGQVDFQASERFARKAMAADRGEAVPPDDVVQNGPAIRLEPEINGARSRLVAALQSGATTRTPVAAARAQSAFDCWLDEASDPIQGVESPWLESKVRNCREDFAAAMTEVDAGRATAGVPAPAPAPTAAARNPNLQSSLVFFDFDRSTVTPEGVTIIKRAIENARSGGVSRIVVIGNTDRAGTEAYNQGLSQRRADAVRAILVREGMSNIQIVTVARGERQPLVQTADGVMEPQNRRAEINFE